MTEIGRCVFTVKESGEDTPFLVAEPWGDMALLYVGGLFFNLHEGAT